MSISSATLTINNSNLPTKPRKSSSSKEGKQEGDQHGDSGKTHKSKETKPHKGSKMSRDEAINIVTENYKKFDLGAGIGEVDGEFGIKDLDKLAKGKGEVAEAAQVLKDENILKELGGENGKISRDEWTKVQKPVEGIKIDKSKMTDKQVKDVEKSLKLLATDPDGSQLLDKIKHDGYTIKFDPNDTRDLNAFCEPDKKTITLYNPFFKKSFSEQTGIIGHEMVHAATPNDGNSKMEEGLAEVVAQRVDARIHGLRLTDDNEKEIFWGKNTDDFYKDLAGQNDIVASLSNLGIKFNWVDKIATPTDGNTKQHQQKPVNGSDQQKVIEPTQ